MEHLHFDKVGCAGLLQINRPKALNALNTATLSELLHAISTLSVSEKLSALVITGAGDKAFIAGADIKEMSNQSIEQMLDFGVLGQKVTEAIENAPFAVIAAINGYALGGGLEIALACDFIYAAESATLGFPEVNLSVLPFFGGTQRLPRLIGVAQAKEMILTGKKLSAYESLQLGLVNKVLPDSELIARALDTAQQIAKHSPFVIKQAKLAIHHGTQMNLHDALSLERNMCALCFVAPEAQQKMKEFIDKRK